MFGLWRRWQIQRLIRRGLSEPHADVLRRQVAYYERLPPPQRRRFRQIVAVLVARCRWEGCEGLEVTDEMRALIAGNAGVMLLGSDDFYFDSVGVILIYPGTIVRQEENETGMIAGEAWENGGIVLAWPEVRAIPYHRGRRNVVIHEFAHHLDALDGEMGGSIPFRDPALQRRWQQVAQGEYQRLLDDVRAQRDTVLDPYGATDQAEFFAVASECFFEQPGPLRRAHPELYEMLTLFYQLDPAQWRT